MQLTLTLRPAAAPVRPTSAWVIPTPDPAAWLLELARWRVPIGRIDLYVLPAADSAAAAAVLVLLDGATPVTTQRALPYGALANLYLPVDAQLCPDISAGEVANLLSTDLAVIHPALGLILFDITDRLRPHQLIAAPTVDADRWHGAVAGNALPPRLTAIAPLAAPDLNELLRTDNDDIGSAALSDLPRGSQPDEKVATRLSDWLLPKVAALQRRLQPGKPDRPGRAAPGKSRSPWLDSVRAGINSRLAAFNNSFQQAREREVQRLIRLLASDPDRGLQYAIPMSGPRDQHRGTSTPGWQLGSRNVDFSLNDLGGGSADYWGVSSQAQQRLLGAYHQSAARELSLGRHRRAAYIYAHLLGDYVAAANALAEGGYHREAALLYRDRLGRPAEAARIFAQGGFYSEAIDLYEALHDHESAGDLYLALADRSLAAAAFRRAVSQRTTQNDLLGAARLLDEKLQDTDQALATLETAWPTSSQARSCLKRWFELVGREGKHHLALLRLRELRAQRTPSQRLSLLADVLKHTALSYPDGAVRDQAADLTRVSAGLRLTSAGEAERHNLLSLLQSLVPDDRLLARDCARYRQMSRSRTQAAAVDIDHPLPVLLQRFDLAESLLVIATFSVGRWFYAAGVSPARSNDLVVMRATWDGVVQTVKWPRALDILPLRSNVLTADPRGVSPTLVISQPGGLRPTQRFAPSDRFPGSDEVGMPEWLPEDVVAATYSADGTLVALSHDEAGAVLSAFGADRRLIATEHLQFDRSTVLYEEDPPNWPFCSCLHQRDRIYIASGRELLCLGPNGASQRLQLQDSARDLAGSAMYSRPRVAVSYVNGGEVLWGGYDWGKRAGFASTMVRPQACFTRGGLLIVVNREEGRVYTTRDLKLAQLLSFPTPDGHPLSVCPAAGLNDFAIILRDGAVYHYRLPVTPD